MKNRKRKPVRKFYKKIYCNVSLGRENVWTESIKKSPNILGGELFRLLYLLGYLQI